MINFDKILKYDIFLNSNKLKNKISITNLKLLTQHHFNKCLEYKKILLSESLDFKKIKSLKDLPFLPAEIFKNYSLKSIKENKVYKILKSSGTSGQIPSKIFLDKENSNVQSKVLVKIVNSIIGSKRLPMIILDSPEIYNDKVSYSARLAGVLGFSIFATEKLFLFDNSMKINFKELDSFLQKYKNEKILLFGFTFIIWKHLCLYKNIKKMNINIPKGILIHGGGWKKLNDKNITNKAFKKELNKLFGIRNVYNYYGMVEQTGSIFLECKNGFFHPSIFSDIIVRDKNSLVTKKINETGLIQTFSLLATSYPGHSILTEDEGVICGLNNCGCGIKGKYFKVLGRLKKSEIRGCSDTYEA